MPETSSDLTGSQLSVWLGQQQSPRAPLYNMVITFEIHGVVHADLFKQAFQVFLDNCDTLRTVFEECSGQPARRVLPQMACDMDLLDFSREDDPDAHFLRWREERQELIFELSKCAFDTALVRLAPDRFIWYLNQHHIITDGASISLIFDATAARYRALCGDVLDNLGDLSSFEAYANHEHRLKATGRIERAKDYWQASSRRARSMNPLSFYGHAQGQPTTRSDRKTVFLGVQRNKALKALSRRKDFGALTPDVALFEILLTVLIAYLYRTSGEPALAIGTPSANRSSLKQRDTIGLLMQVFALCFEIDEEETFETLHRKVRAEGQNFLRHATPGSAGPTLARDFNVMFNYAKVKALHLGDSVVQQRFHHVGHSEAHHYLRLHVQELEDTGELLLELDLNHGAFDATFLNSAAEHFIETLDAFLDGSTTRLKDYELLPESEREKILVELNDTSAPYRRERPLNRLFEEAVANHPARIAVTSGSHSLSYLELDDQANKLAAALSQSGAGDGDVVGLLLDRSVEMIVAMLAVLKTGAAYMPVGGDVPSSRRSAMLEIGNVAVVIYDDAYEAEASASGRISLHVDSNGRAVVSAPTPPEIASTRFDAPAYVLFTSGSTGEPKGVVCKHRSVMNLLEDFEQRRPLLDGANCAWWTSELFDVSVYEIYSALAFGRTLHIVPKQVRGDGRRYLSWLTENRIQSAYAPPFMLEEAAEQLESEGEGPPLERLLVGVEPILEETLARISAQLPQLQIINGYGPTEATVCTTLYSLGQNAPRRNTPIGRPVRNTGLYLLDESLRPVPVGAVGEIYVGGDGLACGYLNRPDLTAERFVTNPFVPDPQARLYRTGDLARYLPDGNLMFVGRADDQLKIRGQRLEPREVELALLAHPAVREALVISREQDGEVRLVAYLVANQHPTLTAQDWYRWLSGRLPSFMIPSAYMVLDAFPLTVSGKVDRQALPPPPKRADCNTETARAAVTPLEHALSEIFADILELSSVDVEADFLELGGDSIDALRIAVKASEAGLQLTPRQIFEASTISSLARLVETAPEAVQARPAKSGNQVSPSEMADVLAEFGEDLDEYQSN